MSIIWKHIKLSLEVLYLPFLYRNTRIPTRIIAVRTKAPQRAPLFLSPLKKIKPERLVS